MSTDPALADPPLDPLSDAYARLRSALDALPRAGLSRVNVDVPTVVARALATTERLEPLRARLAPLFAGGDDPLAQVATRARALLFVHRGCGHAVRGPTAGAVGNELHASRARLLAVAGVLVAWGHLEGAPVRRLGRARTAAGMVVEVRALVGLLREQLAATEALSALRRADLDAAEQRATELVGALGQAVTQRGARRAAARLERQRALTLLEREYARLRNAVRFVRSAESDVEQWAPALRDGRRGRRGQAA